MTGFLLHEERTDIRARRSDEPAHAVWLIVGGSLAACFDDIPQAAARDRVLTTVRRPHAGNGAAAARR